MKEMEIRIEVEREADGTYFADVPALPGVMAHGATEDEAVTRALKLSLGVVTTRRPRKCVRRPTGKRSPTPTTAAGRSAATAAGSRR